jgi:hypothetical protein
MTHHELEQRWIFEAANSERAQADAVGDTLDHIEDLIQLCRYIENKTIETELIQVRGTLRSLKQDLVSNSDAMAAEVAERGGGA